jgi:epoxyqueuosine reductase
LAQPDRLELLRRDDAAFKARFAGTPKLRIKRRGVLCNVCVALENIGAYRCYHRPTRLGKSRARFRTLIAEHARWALAEIAARRE